MKELLPQKSTTKQNVVRNTLWLFSGQLAGRTLKAAIMIYAARLLGAANFGIFTLAQSIAALFMVFSDIGVNPVIAREVAKDLIGRARWITTGLVLKLGLLVLSLVVTILFGRWMTTIPAVKILLPLLALVFVFDGIRDFGFSVIRAREEMHWEAFVIILGNAVTLIAGLILMGFWKTPFHLSLAFLLGSAVGALAILLPLRHQLTTFLRNLDLSSAHLILVSAWPFVIWTILGVLLVYSDSIMLGLLKDATAVGLYNAASRPIQLFFALPELLAAAVFPTLARRARTGDFLTPVTKSLGAVMLVALPLTFGGIILGKPAIAALYGNTFQESAPVFQILLLLVLLQFPAAIVGNAIFAHDRHFEMIRYVAFAAVANVSLNWLFIPGYGAVGSAVATVVSRAIALAGAFGILRRIQPLSVFHTVWRGMLATPIMAVGVWASSSSGMNLWFSVVLGIILYLLALQLLREPVLHEVYLVLRTK